MRFLPALLAKLYPPVPFNQMESMDTHTSNDRGVDPIALGIDAAVSEHERVSFAVREPRYANLLSTLDEVLERIGSNDAPSR